MKALPLGLPACSPPVRGSKSAGLRGGRGCFALASGGELAQEDCFLEITLSVNRHQQGHHGPISAPINPEIRIQGEQRQAGVVFTQLQQRTIRQRGG